MAKKGLIWLHLREGFFGLYRELTSMRYYDNATHQVGYYFMHRSRHWHTTNLIATQNLIMDMTRRNHETVV